jgi:hypothetical protein
VPEAIAAPPASASSATPEPATVAIVTNGSGSCAGGATPACEAACSSHRPGSCFELAKALEKTGTAKDLGRAARLYQAECDHATFPACGRLATLYANGKGVTRDTLRAVTLYDLACSGGDGTACVSVGAMKFGGDGVPKDQALGARYFRSGCSKGEAEGCMRFSIAKLTGAGVTKDVSAGLDELDGMCTRGNGAACAELGTAYDRGLGVDLAADSDRARRYAEKSRTAAKR